MGAQPSLGLGFPKKEAHRSAPCPCMDNRSQHHPRAPVPRAGAGGHCKEQPLCCAQPWWLLSLSRTAQRAPSWQQHGKEPLDFWSFHLFAEELEEGVVCQGAFKHHSRGVLGLGGAVTSSAGSSSPVPFWSPAEGSGRSWGLQGRAGQELSFSCCRQCWD